MKVPFCNLAAVNAEVRPQLDAAYQRVMARGQYILGPEVEKFEEEWADYCGRSYCVGTGNCFDAMTMMLRAYGIGPGDEVIVPANTYIATWLAVSAVGATPVPVEPNDSHNISAGLVSLTALWRAKAVLLVHLYGRPANVAAWRVLVGPDMPLLVDAAQAHGIKGDELGDCAAFSFYPTKNLGALGDGGAIVTNNEAIAAYIARLRNYGSSSKNRHDHLGCNSRLDELQAAFLRVKLPYLDEFNARRQRNATIYGGGFGSTWHQFVVRAKDRPVYRAELAQRGIETLIHYPTPPHLQPAYAHLGYRPGAFPIAERLAREVVSLPVGPEVTEAQANYVAETAMEYA